ncbi:MAG TPA: methyltransferase domain-containing protein [Solirubrobacteraceae bacterium]|nr:methyltransferase domain-containing protein [Solirubrobacteraceae bacterium]
MEGVPEQLIGAYDRAAPTYDVAGFSYFAPFGERLAELALLQPGERVLDAACGAGAVLAPAAQHVAPGGEVVGIDVAPRMVERARLAVADVAHARAEVMDATALRFADASFDAVLCGFGLSALVDPDAALAEWRRVLSPEGRLGVSAWENLEDRRWLWEGELLRELAHEVPAELLETVGRMSQRFNEADKLGAELEAAGFAGVSVHQMAIERTYESAEAWWEWIWSHGTRAFAEALPEPALERFRSAAFERLAGAGRRARSRQFVALLATARPAG